MRTTQTGDGSLTLHSERYGQTFHSHHGAVTEARHVFLDASGVAERLLRGQETRVLEVGFGTGLNCWLAADAATGAGTRRELTSLEQSLLSAATVQELGYSRELQEPALLERYLDWRSSQPKAAEANMAARHWINTVIVTLSSYSISAMATPAASPRTGTTRSGRPSSRAISSEPLRTAPSMTVP